jgi:hypothetical protein
VGGRALAAFCSCKNARAFAKSAGTLMAQCSDKSGRDKKNRRRPPLTWNCDRSSTVTVARYASRYAAALKTTVDSVPHSKATWFCVFFWDGGR